MQFRNSSSAIMKKKPRPFGQSLCVPITCFHGQGNYPLPFRNMPVACFRQRKAPTFRSVSLCSHCLFSWLGQLSFAVKKHAGGMFQVKKSPDLSVRALCSHYLFSRPVTRQLSSAQMSLTSVFGMGTGGPSSQSIRTHVRKCLYTSYIKLSFADFCYSPLIQLFYLVTHTGFEPMLTA